MLFDSNVCLRITASPHNTHYGENLTCRNNVFWGGGWSSKVSDPQLIACLRTSPQGGLLGMLHFDTNLIGLYAVTKRPNWRPNKNTNGNQMLWGRWQQGNCLAAPPCFFPQLF